MNNRLTNKRFSLLLFLAALLLLALWLGVKGWRVYQAGQSLLAKQAEIESLADGRLTELDPDAAEALVLAVRQDILTIKNETAFLMPIAPHLEWLPTVGPLVAALPHLLEMADAGTETAAYAIRGLKPALLLIQDENASGASPLPQFARILTDAQADVAQASLAMERVLDAREALGDPGDLPWRIRTLLEKIDPWLPMGADGLKLLQTTPELLGMNGARRYLLAAQNEDELRPTGGFLSGAGVLTVDDGRIIDLQFLDANVVDDWEHKPYGIPPAPLEQFMGLELFLFRDANFWPDFPTSAEKMIALYRYGQDVPPIDGAIAIDQRFLWLLLDAIGGVPLPESEQIVNRDNIMDMLRAAWAEGESEQWGEWGLVRKGFLGYFAQAIQTHIESNFSTIDPIALATNMEEAGRQKHLQIYLRDPAAQAIIEEMGWDGRINPPSQDILAVADANMGYNKANVHIQREINYQIDLSDDGAATADLLLTYIHSGAAEESVCVQGSSSLKYDTGDYFALADDCYWNYLRVYAPPNAILLESSPHTVPGSTLIGGNTWSGNAAAVDDLPGVSVFANFTLTPRGETTAVQMRYQLPDTVVQPIDDHNQYRLDLYKQAGVADQTTRITVVLPPESELLSASLTPTAVNDNILLFDFLLDEDMELIVAYR